MQLRRNEEQSTEAEQLSSDKEKENQLRKAEFDLKKNLILERLEKGSELKEWFNSHYF